MGSRRTALASASTASPRCCFQTERSAEHSCLAHRPRHQPRLQRPPLLLLRPCARRSQRCRLLPRRWRQPPEPPRSRRYRPAGASCSASTSHGRQTSSHLLGLRHRFLPPCQTGQTPRHRCHRPQLRASRPPCDASCEHACGGQERVLPQMMQQVRLPWSHPGLLLIRGESEPWWQLVTKTSLCHSKPLTGTQRIWSVVLSRVLKL